MADDLRLKVAMADYDTQDAKLSNKISELETIRGEYEALMNKATDIFETDDSNYERLRSVIKENVQQVSKELALLNESKQMLNRQRENLESLNTNVESMFTNVQETVKTAFETIKLAGDLVD